MSDQVLARKWRPSAFDDVAGQDHVLRALANAMAAGRLHHAYLFSGTRGVGKTTVARILARCLNCETGVTATPCGACGACRELEEGRFVDLIEVDAASRTKVEDTRELLDNVQYAPTAGRFKIYLIDEVHMLSAHSFNALLKTLEEPPPHVKFLLATTDPQKLPPTVLSRCLQFHLKRLSPETIRTRLEAVLEAEGVPVETGAVARLARAADGSMRDGLSLLDQAIAFGAGSVRDAEVAAMLGSVERTTALELLEALAAGDGDALFAGARGLLERGVDFDDVLAEVMGAVHTLALAQQVPGMIADDEPERARWLTVAQQVPAEDLQLYYQIGVQGRRDLSYAPDPATGFEMTLLRMLAFRPADAPPVASGTAGPSATAEPERAAGPPPLPESRSGDSADVASAGHDAVPPGPAPANPDALQTNAAAAWAQWAGEFDGALGALANHCEWVEQRGERVILQLESSQAYLLNDERRERLRTFIVERCPGVRDIEITPADAPNTPARMRQAQNEAQMQAAREAIHADPVFADLQHAFDGRIHSIRPPGDDGSIRTHSPEPR